MASTKRAPRDLPLALELLESDHRQVDQLFNKYDAMKEDDDESRVELARRICKELTIHARVEEALLYPWLRENMDESDKVAEAEVEHASLKRLIAEIEPAGAAEEKYDAKVKVLSEYVKHHVQEEENEIFPEVADEKQELDEIGQEIAAMKAELMAELGLEDEDDSEPAGQGAARPQGKGRGKTQRASR